LWHIFEKKTDFAEISQNIDYFITTTNPSSLSKWLNDVISASRDFWTVCKHITNGNNRLRTS